MGSVGYGYRNDEKGESKMATKQKFTVAVLVDVRADNIAHAARIVEDALMVQQASSAFGSGVAVVREMSGKPVAK